MKILVEYEGDIFAYGSYMGKHYWYVHQGNTPRWNRRRGVIVPTMMWEDIGLAALSQGFTREDFRKIQTVAPENRQESHFSTRKTTAKSRDTNASKTPRIAKEKKPTESKSKLHNSIKLF